MTIFSANVQFIPIHYLTHDHFQFKSSPVFIIEPNWLMSQCILSANESKYYTIAKFGRMGRNPCSARKGLKGAIAEENTKNNYKKVGS